MRTVIGLENWFIYLFVKESFANSFSSFLGSFGFLNLKFNGFQHVLIIQLLLYLIRHHMLMSQMATSFSRLPFEL